MGILHLKNVEVTRLNNNGNGLQVVESNESNGKTFTMRYTVWFKEPSGLSVGDHVSLSGFLSAKVGEPWVGREGQEMRSVELGLNAPRIEGDGPTVAQPAEGMADPWAQEPSADSWATAAPGGYASSETPF